MCQGRPCASFLPTQVPLKVWGAVGQLVSSMKCKQKSAEDFWKCFDFHNIGTIPSFYFSLTIFSYLEMQMGGLMESRRKKKLEQNYPQMEQMFSNGVTPSEVSWGQTVWCEGHRDDAPRPAWSVLLNLEGTYLCTPGSGGLGCNPIFCFSDKMMPRLLVQGPHFEDQGVRPPLALSNPGIYPWTLIGKAAPQPLVYGPNNQELMTWETPR